VGVEEEGSVMATGMGREAAARMLEHYRLADPGERMRIQLHTAAPPLSAFRPTGLKVAPYASRKRPGKLALYETRAEHARAHRLAAERNRRNRRRARHVHRQPTWRSTGVVNWTMTVDTSGITAAMAGIGAAFRRIGEHMSVVHARLLEVNLVPLMRLYGQQPADEATGPDTD
jgi:hypothetical protein